MASFILLSLYIRHEFSFDRFHQNYEQIYQVVDSAKNNASMDLRLKQYLVDNYPEIKNATILNAANFSLELSNKEGKIVSSENLVVADSSFFSVFSFELIQGKVNQVFEREYSIVLTERLSRKLFGTVDPIGKQVNVDHNWDCTVTGIVADPPVNSSIQFDFVMGAHHGTHMKYSCHKCGPEPNDPGKVYMYSIFIALQKGASIQSLSEKIENPVLFHDHFPQNVAFQPLDQLYLYNRFPDSSFQQGNLKLLKILGAISLVILLLAVVNYINLTISRSSLRAKEIGIKRTLGASRNKVIKQFVIESSLICIGSFLIALLVTRVFYSYFTRIIDSPILLPEINLSILIILILFPFILGTITGILPGYIFSKFKPISIASGKLTKLKKYVALKTSFNEFQFSISISLLICLFIIQKQLHFVKNKDLGFNQEQLLRIDMGRNSEEKVQSFGQKLIHHSKITSISKTVGSPGEIYIWLGLGKDFNQEHSMTTIWIDSSFFETFDVELVEGRKIQQGDYDKACYFNEAAINQLNIDSYQGKKINNRYEVIGVVKDFHFSSLRDKIQPLCLIYGKNGGYDLNVKMDNSVAEVMSYIRDEWQATFPDYVFQYEFYDDRFDAMYKSEEKLGNLISFFTVIALMISSLGIFGLAEYVSKQRTKEIGIRKVVGATVEHIVLLLSKDFTRWVILAFVIAIPVSTWIMSKWLENFSYKTNLDWWLFAFAGVVTVLIALITVSFQTVKAALANPVDSLRYE